MIDLNGKWYFKCTKDKEWLEAIIPGSMYTDLVRLNRIQDPFYGGNEQIIKNLSEYDYEYKKKIIITDDILSKAKIILECEGIDTLADIYINGYAVGYTENMHRRYRFNIKDKLIRGENEVYIKIHSPLQYIRIKDEEKELWGMQTTIDGYPHIRKAHNMFGWDFGPQLPDVGIYRNIQINTYDMGRIVDVYVKQKHIDTQVVLDIDVEVESEENKVNIVEVEIVSPNKEQRYKESKIVENKGKITIIIADPQKWWPNGYGNQALYEMSIILKQDNQLIDDYKKKIGLRTLTIRRKKEKETRGFCFEINGIEIFAMGANYIPEDSLLGRRSKDKTRKLLEGCVSSHFNSIRVWGGGIYPEDYFYDLCDELGLIVWQDFMFACSMYDLSDTFKNNLLEEIEDVLRRIRNHACLGILCGNNEMEAAWVQWGIPDDKKLKEDYLELFERIIPEMVKKYNPNTFYWPASPSSGGGFIDPNSYSHGNAHYWDVWHGKQMFEECRKYYFKFTSEYGFQSFPSVKTIKTFTNDMPYNIYSYDMDRHQKCGKEGEGTRIIMEYMGAYYKQPTSFENTVYMSQILQGDYLQIAIEHWRRHRGRCMGSIYWQMNDCWPGTTWATIDYFGRWKASQYYVKRAYAPILMSAIHHIENETVTVHITNDTLSIFSGEIRYRWVKQSVEYGEFSIHEVQVEPLTAKKVATLKCDFNQEEAREIYLQYEVVDVRGKIKSTDTLLLVKPKYFNFLKPRIQVNIEKIGKDVILELTSDVFVRRVGIDFEEIDVRLNDNYFDLYPHITRTLKLVEGHWDEEDLESLRRQIYIRTVNEV